MIVIAVKRFIVLAHLCRVVEDLLNNICLDRPAKESSLKGKTQYNWPPCTNQFRSAALVLQTLLTFFYKTSYLHEEVNCTESFPTVSVPWFSIQSIHLWNISLWPQMDSNISSGSGKDSLHGDHNIKSFTFVNYPLDSSAAAYSQNFIKYVLLKVLNIVI